MIDVSIISIQHTGTKLLVSKFHTDELALKDESEGLHVGHISDGQFPHIMRLIKKPTIIPLRHPYLVAESWSRKGKDLGELIRNYHILIDVLDKYSPFYVNVDLELRDSQIDKINKYLNLTLSKNWPIINSKSGTYNLDPRKLTTPPAVIEFVERNSQFFDVYCRETARRINGANH